VVASVPCPAPAAWLALVRVATAASQLLLACLLAAAMLALSQ
jgi:hypothetical protein